MGVAGEVDVLLLLAEQGHGDAQAARRALTRLRGVAQVHEVRARRANMLRIIYDPAQISAAMLRATCEEAGCAARLTGL